MTVLSAALVMAVFVIALFPKTPVARRLRRWLIVDPAAFLSALTFKRIVRGALILPVLVLMALTAPELLALTLSFGDAMILAEVIAAMSVLAITGAARRPMALLKRAGAGLLDLCGKVVAEPVRRFRERRSRSAEQMHLSDRGDDPEPGVFGAALA